MGPLSNRDINAQGLQSPNFNYHQTHQISTPHVRRGQDENSTPISTASKTSTSHLLARAKTSGARLDALRARSYTPLSSSSKLPRRSQTPSSAKNIVPQAKKQNWATAVKARASSGRSTPDTSQSQRPSTAPNTVTIQLRNQVWQASSSVSFKLIRPQSKMGLPTDTDKPLPMEKALPPRPIATFVDTMSPSKNGRSIIDAAEKPLRLSPGTPDEADWPTLSPVCQSTLSTAPPRKTIAPDAATSTVRQLYPYFPQPNTRSRWSVDTPETPASTMPPSVMLNEQEEDAAQPSPTYQTEQERSTRSSGTNFLNGTSGDRWPSLTDFNQPEQQPLPLKTEANHGDHHRSISLTDRTSDGRATMSTVDTIEVTADCTAITQDTVSRPHSPPPCSFSQSRANNRRSSLPDTPTPQNSLNNRARHHATASRIPIFDPRKTPNIVDIKPRTPVPDTPDRTSIPTFGGRRLDTPSDLAALDQDPRAMRQPSSRMLRRNSSERLGAANDTVGLAKKVSLANMKNQIRRLTPSPSDTEQPVERIPREASITFAGSRDNSTSRVRKLSGQLLSEYTHLGPTLTIHDEADDILLDKVSNGSMTDQDAAFNQFNRHPPHDEENGADQEPANLAVELSLAFNTPNQQGPVSHRTMRANVSDLLAANNGQSGWLPGATIDAKDNETDQQITATLSLLEGTPPERSPTQDDFLTFANNYGKQIRQRIQPPEDLHPAYHQDRDSESSEALTPEMVAERYSTTSSQLDQFTALPRPMDEFGNASRPPIRRPSERMPSYMSPTPASEARRVSKQHPKEGKSIGFPINVSDKASRILGTGEHDLPRDGLGKRTPSKKLLRTGSPGHTPLTQHPEKMTRLPKMQPVTHHCQHAESPSALRSGRTTPFEPEIKSKVGSRTSVVGRLGLTSSQDRPRSQSKNRFMNNVKGFFTSKRDAAPPVSHVGGKQLNRQSLKPVPNSNSCLSKSRLSITEPTSQPAEMQKPLPDPTSPSSPAAVPVSCFSPSGQSVRKINNTSALVDITSALMNEAGNEPDLTKKERLISLAQVMIDTLANSRQAERSMIAAQQAAESAKVSYEMTQRSVLEMSKLLSRPKGGMGGVLRKIAVKNGH